MVTPGGEDVQKTSFPCGFEGQVLYGFECLRAATVRGKRTSPGRPAPSVARSKDPVAKTVTGFLFTPLFDNSIAE